MKYVQYVSAHNNNIKMSPTATIVMLTGQRYEIKFEPTEPMWSFAARIATVLPNGFYNPKTPNHTIIFHGKPINTFENRLIPVGNIITETEPRLCAIDWTLQCGAGTMIFYNALSPTDGCDRSICAICLEKINDITSGSTLNPMIPKVLKCGHTFHRGCINQAFNTSGNYLCPTCRK
jgi:hypothetical protein